MFRRSQCDPFLAGLMIAASSFSACGRSNPSNAVDEEDASGGASLSSGSIDGGATGQDTSGAEAGGAPADGPAAGGADRGEGGSAGMMGGAMGGQPHVVPERIRLSPLAYDEDGLHILTAQLKEGKNGLEFYAMLFNRGSMGTQSACGGGMGIELYDADQAPLGAYTASILGRQTYEAVGLNQAVNCIDTDEVGMAQLLDFNDNLRLEDVHYIVYRFTYFADVFFTNGLDPLDYSIQNLVRTVQGDTTVIRGEVKNDTPVGVANPGVIVVSLDAEGLPLTTVLTSTTEPLFPGDVWTFSTDPVTDAGVEQMAFPFGTFQFAP